MKYTLNGQTTDLTASTTITQMLEQNGYKDMLVAVARNGTFIPKSQYETTTLDNGDEIEIVSPMQGG